MRKLVLILIAFIAVITLIRAIDTDLNTTENSGAVSKPAGPEAGQAAGPAL